MNSAKFSAIVLAVAAVASGSAFADDSGLTREQVKAELAAAQRTGNVIANGESGQTVAELNPARFPATASTKTRAEVKAELAEAQRTGDIVINGETGETLAQVFPARYADAVAQNASNAQVSSR